MISFKSKTMKLKTRKIFWIIFLIAASALVITEIVRFMSEDSEKESLIRSSILYLLFVFQGIIGLRDVKKKSKLLEKKKNN